MTQGGSATKEKIVAAALATLRTEGFAGASARVIARRGEFNQALIFYHFGTINDLLLAALDATAAQRLSRYEAAIAATSGAEELLDVASRLYKEDLEEGHITVLTELIAGSLTEPTLGPAIVARMQPWVELAEDAIRRATQGSALADLLPARDVAFALVALYLGVDLLTQLDGDRERAESLFAAGERLVPFVSLLGGTS